MSFYFIFNGPPKSGKSTLAREAIRHFTTRQIEARPESLAAPMKQFISVLMGQPYSSISKDEHSDLLGQTPRRFLIDLSETYLKKRYSNDLFGRALLHRSKPSLPIVYVVDDCGFNEEFSVLPRRNVCLVRVIRPSFGFDSDSRGYLPKPDRILYNDADLKKAYSITSDIVDYAVIKWRLWKSKPNFNLKLVK